MTDDSNDNDKVQRVVDARMKLMARFRDAHTASPSMSDDKARADLLGGRPEPQAEGDQGRDKSSTPKARADLLGGRPEPQAEGDQGRDNSRDSFLLALITLGDGWHHSHHRFPGSIRAGVKPGQLDVAYLFVKVLEGVGLATDLREPRVDQSPSSVST